MQLSISRQGHVGILSIRCQESVLECAQPQMETNMATWSGLYNGVYGANHALQFSRNANQKLIRMALRTPGQAVTRELLLTLIAGAVGDTAADSQSRVGVKNASPANIMGQDGVVPVETETFINRATTNADATELAAIINAGPAITRVKTPGRPPEGDPRYIY